MKIRKYLTIGCLGLVCLTACGTSEKAATETTAVTTESDIASEDVVVPDRPAFKDMGTITLPDLNKIPVELYYEKQEITDDYVDEYMQNVAENYTNEVDRAAKEGDTVTIDYVGKIDGEEFDGGSATDASVVLGQGYFIEDLENGMIGMSKGETKDITVKFPDDYYSDDLAGKEAVFTVTVKTVAEPSKLTDNFVILHSTEGSKTVAEYKEEMRKKLEEWSTISYDESKYYAAINYLLSNSEIELSDAMLDYEKQSEKKSFVDNLADSDMTIADYAEQLGSTEDEILDQVLSYAEDNAKREFIVEALIEQGNYEVTDEAKAEYIEYCGKQYGDTLSEDEVKTLFGIEDDAAFDENVKTYLMKKDLVAKCEVTVVDPSTLYTDDTTTEDGYVEVTEDTVADTEAATEVAAESTEG